jgi:signal transduction histidine kinase
MEAELVRINDLVEQVLTLARLEATEKMPLMTELSLNEIIDKVVSDAKFEAEGIGADIRGSATSNISMMANEELLLSAIENVVRNAIHHTDPGSTVEVGLSVKNGGALIVVRDHGGGVPEGEITKLFQPFYRVDDARGDNGGFGLGLAIAAQAILIHQGSIRAYNEHPGLRVEMWLPINLASAS